MVKRNGLNSTKETDENHLIRFEECLKMLHVHWFMVLTILIFVCPNRLTSHTEFSSSCEMNVAQESVTCVVSMLVSHWSVFIWSIFCVPVIVSDEFAFFFHSVLFFFSSAPSLFQTQHSSWRLKIKWRFPKKKAAVEQTAKWCCAVPNPGLLDVQATFCSTIWFVFPTQNKLVPTFSSCLLASSFLYFCHFFLFHSA